MVSPDSILDPLSSRTSCSWPAMIPANHHLLHHVVRTQIVFYLTSDEYATVRPRLSRHSSDRLSPVTTVNSIVLLTNGISFALQAVVLLTIGAWADYGTWR